MTDKIKYCCKCGEPLGIELSIIKYLGRDESTKIDYCLECINKATRAIIQKRISEVQDANVRRELRGRLPSP